jgi:hypothetical protein
MYDNNACQISVRETALEARQNPVYVRSSPFSRGELQPGAQNFRQLQKTPADPEEEYRLRNIIKAFIRTIAGAALLLMIGMASASPTEAGKRSASCGMMHVVAPGETLFAIAQGAYGVGRQYKRIYEANTDLLPNPASLKIGDQLLIPCLDGTGPGTRLEAIAIGLLKGLGEDEVTHPRLSDKTAEAREIQNLAARSLEVAADGTRENAALDQNAGETPQPDLLAIQAAEEAEGATVSAMGQLPLERADIQFLTGSGFPPYAHEGLPEGGIATQLVRYAISVIAPGQAFHITFVNDWSVHSELLLPGGGFDVGFPWYKPNCSQQENLSLEVQTQCAEFKFSNAILAVPVGFYARLKDPAIAATSYSELVGKRLCRPKGHFMHDLEQNNLSAPNVSIVRPRAALTCFVKLIRGEVDVVTLMKREVDAEVLQLGNRYSFAEIKGLTSKQTLHAIVAKSNPNADIYLDLVNRGLSTLMASANGLPGR